MTTRTFGGFPALWDPWRELERLESDMGRLFNGTRRGLAAEGLPVNVWVDEDRVTVTAELPGVPREALDVSVVGRRLTIRGERSTAAPAEGGRYHRRERDAGRFGRALNLPFPVEAAQVSATLRDGVLTVTLPRTEADRPRKIAVQAA
jgi:HSP20 family protein